MIIINHQQNLQQSLKRKINHEIWYYYDENTKLLLQELNKENNLLTSNIKKCESDIDSSFNLLLTKISQKQQEIKQKLKNIEKEKKLIINEKREKIMKQQNEIKNAIKSQHELIQHANNIKSDERKQKIISIAKNVINSHFTNNIIDIDTDIRFVFNENSIQSV